MDALEETPMNKRMSRVAGGGADILKLLRSIAVSRRCKDLAG
jgi:hypothetical protein